MGFGAALFIMGCAASIGYFFGKERALQESVLLNGQIKTVVAERDAMQNDITNLRAQAQTATMRFETVQKDFQTAVPEGPTGDLIKLVNKQIEEGMDPERIAFLIRSNRAPRNCADPASQRFIVSTPAYTGAASEASIAEGGIRIRGSGASAKNEKGDPEAWYDASKAVSLEFVIKNGGTEKKQGIMPLSHSIVLDGKEYRFTVTEGARSFAKVNFDSCDYP